MLNSIVLSFIKDIIQAELSFLQRMAEDNTSQFILEFEHMSDRLDDHETTIDANRVNLSRLESGLNRLDYVIQNNTYQIADLRSINNLSEQTNGTLRKLVENVEFQGDQLLALHESIRRIETIT